EAVDPEIDVSREQNVQPLPPAQMPPAQDRAFAIPKGRQWQIFRLIRPVDGLFEIRVGDNRRNRSHFTSRISCADESSQALISLFPRVNPSISLSTSRGREFAGLPCPR